MPQYTSSYGSGAIIARRTVELIKNSVEKAAVITDGEFELRDEKNIRVLSIPLGINERISLVLARVGFIEDYLDFWARNVFNYLKSNQEIALGFKLDNDVSIIATSVGYMGAFKLGYLLKENYGCNLVLHFHDPIKYSLVNGEKYSKLPYASRESHEKKYIEAADKIATCSNTFRRYLGEKYPESREKIKNFYFGWIESPYKDYIDKIPKIGNLSITYGGVFGSVQGPEILGEALRNVEGITVYYIGNWSNYKPVRDMKGKNIVKLPRMDHQDYIKFLIESSDLGFLSLSKSYFSACVPAKLYEYINTKKPIVAALYESDTSRIIRDNGFGISVDYDSNSLRNSIKAISEKDLMMMKSQLTKERGKWDFNITMKGFLDWVIE